MAVPSFEFFMLPLLQFASDGREHHIRDAIGAIAEPLILSDDDRHELLPKGRRFKFNDRVQWASSYLKKAGLPERVGRGRFPITQCGMEVLQSNPEQVDREFLMRFPEFVSPSTERADQIPFKEHFSERELTPKEMHSSIHEQLQNQLADELLE